MATLKGGCDIGIRTSKNKSNGKVFGGTIEGFTSDSVLGFNVQNFEVDSILFAGGGGGVEFGNSGNIQVIN